MALTREMFKEITPDMIEHVKALAFKANGQCIKIYDILNIKYPCYNADFRKPQCPFCNENAVDGGSICVVYNSNVLELCHEFLRMVNNSEKRKLKDLEWEDSSAYGE